MLPPDAAVQLAKARARPAPAAHRVIVSATAEDNRTPRQAAANRVARQRVVRAIPERKPVQARVAAAPRVAAAAPTARVAAAAPAAAREVTDTPATLVPDFVHDQAYVDAQNAGGLALDDYDSQTLLGRQQANANRDYQTGLLKLAIGDQRNGTAEDFAGRGIIRSGAYLGAQDMVDAAGIQQQGAIDQDITDFINDRAQGRLGVQSDNRDKLNAVLAQLQGSFYSAQKKAS